MKTAATFNALVGVFALIASMLGAYAADLGIITVSEYKALLAFCTVACAVQVTILRVLVSR